MPLTLMQSHGRRNTLNCGSRSSRSRRRIALAEMPTEPTCGRTPRIRLREAEDRLTPLGVMLSPTTSFAYAREPLIKEGPTGPATKPRFGGAFL